MDRPVPPLFHPRLEAMAQNLAIDMPPRQAGEKAGYAYCGPMPRRRFEGQAMARRVAEIKHSAQWCGSSDLALTIDTLARIAGAAESLATVAGLKEARSALAEIGKLRRLPPDRAAPDDNDIKPRWATLPEEQWVAKFAPPE